MHCRAYRFLLVGGVMLSLASASAAQVASTSTQDIGVVVGPERPFSGFFAGDIGMSTEWKDGGVSKITLLFGDMHKSSSDLFGAAPNNDAAVTFALSSASTASEPLESISDSAFSWADMQVSRGAELDMGGGRTPISIASPIESNAPFAFFNRAVYAKCTASGDCGDGLICDKSMGALFPYSSGENVVPCVQSLSNPFCFDVDLNINAGLCRDKNSSLATYVNWSTPSGVPVWDPVDGAFRSEAGKILSTAYQQEIGRAVPGDASTYNTAKFVTNKFATATMRVTKSQLNYARADVDNAAATLWMWGRPSFYSNGSHGARSELYIARAPNPAFTGNVLELEYRRADGSWSSSQLEAAPVDVAPGAQWEDGVAGFTTVTFVGGKWVMLYGGDTSALWDSLFGGPILNGMTRGNGSIKVRTAPDPWGPWSVPRDVISPVEMAARLCPTWGATCNPLFFPEIGPGMLYAPQIVESWNSTITGGVSIGWLVSLWNPYQVEQMKTDIVF